MTPSLPAEIESNSPLPGVIHGYVSVSSQGGESVFQARKDALPASTEAYHATSGNRDEARRALESMRFEIIAESSIGIAIAGPPGAYEELTGGTVVTRERLLNTSAGMQRYVTHIDIVGEGQPPALAHGNARSPATQVEGVLIERPLQFHGVFPAPIPPSVEDFHLRVPDDVALGLSATQAHRQGRQGDGVVVAMVDSGQYAHPFFAVHHYDVRPPVAIVSGTSPTQDPVGHGTGESANIFAAAPGCVLRPYRASNNQGNLVGAIGGFLRAKADSPTPAILTNSWGGDGPFPPSGPPDEFEIAWALEIQDAIQQGIFVVFSAGNGHFSIEPQVPGVLAAGGTFMTQDYEISASDYTSGYPSPWFQVTVPDVCGLVGMRPRAQYIMLPLQPGSAIDVSESQRASRDPGDGTTFNDGWARFSGSSAAAPQIAGVAALILGAKPGLTPGQVTQALRATAIDVTSGNCHPRFNFAATTGHDAATGNGLVNATAAVQFALDNF